MLSYEIYTKSLCIANVNKGMWTELDDISVDNGTWVKFTIDYSRANWIPD